MGLTAENWIAIAGIAAVLIVGIGGWYFLRQKKPDGTQIQRVKNGTGIQSGRDTKIGD